MIKIGKKLPADLVMDPFMWEENWAQISYKRRGMDSMHFMLYYGKQYEYGYYASYNHGSKFRYTLPEGSLGVPIGYTYLCYYGIHVTL